MSASCLPLVVVNMNFTYQISCDKAGLICPPPSVFIVCILQLLLSANEEVIEYDQLFPTEKAVVFMETADQMGDLHGSTLTKGPPCDLMCHYVNAINASPRNIGKEGKFQLFVCLGIR